MTDKKPSSTPNKTSTGDKRAGVANTKARTSKTTVNKRAAANTKESVKTTAVETNSTLSDAAPATAPAQAEKSSNASATFAILLSLVALVGTGFTWYQTQVEQVRSESGLAIGITEIGGQMTRLGDSISRLQKEQANVVSQEQLGARIADVTGAIDTQIRSLSDKQGQISASIDKVNADLQKGVNQYVIEEVSQLLRLANNNVLFSTNPDSAIDALMLADAQLKGLADPRYSTVRSAINQELTLLRNIERVDIEGISASLSTIASTVSSLPLANEPPATALTIDRASDVGEGGWRAEIAEIGRLIVNSIQVQRIDQPPKPLLVPEQRYFLDQNLQLTLAKAELALLQQQPSVFNRSIASAVQWLNDYFDLDDQRVSNVLSQLNAMQEQNIVLAMPTITGSYGALQAIKGGQQ